MNNNYSIITIGNDIFKYNMATGETWRLSTKKDKWIIIKDS